MTDFFDIAQHVEFNAKNRAICPSCAASKGASHTRLNLSLLPNGAYKCFAGCTSEDIRSALGTEKPKQIPQTLAAASPGAKKVTISPQKVAEAHATLMQSDGPAKQWLINRGITTEMIEHFRLGVARSKVGKKHYPSIAIPIPASDPPTQYFQKKRVAPWLPVEELPAEYKPWSQYGIPATVWFAYKPDQATATYLCEGEWDAIMLGWMAKQVNASICVATFTCGAGTIPCAAELEKLPGAVTIFYDRNDKPLKNGDIPGEVGAKKVAKALGDRAKIAAVPMPENSQVVGWDVSDAINHGFKWEDFILAADQAVTSTPDKKPSSNPLRDRLMWNEQMLALAPDYTEWLVPDLLTADELFLLAAGPRAGKSLLAMTLTKAVAEGSEFLGRPVTQGTVIYVCLEDGLAKLKEREQAQGWSHDLPVVWLNKFKLHELPHLKEIAEELDPRLIVLDTLSRIKDASISESSAEMSMLLEPLQELAKEIGCCILLVHHTGKVNADNANAIDIFDTVRGSSAIRAVCRGTLIIAAVERNFRLLAENGWGKHDLNIVLDANTWTWKLLGQWKPESLHFPQKDQICEYLKQVGQATLEQISEGTKIPKKSLYEQLSRLQASKDADEKIIKEGSRRKYTYRLALFNTIQQLNSLLNSDNPDTEIDTGYIQQKNISSLQGDHSESDHLPNPPNDHPPLPPTPTDIVEYRCSNVDSVSVSPIQQLFNTPNEQTASTLDTAGDTRYSTLYSTPPTKTPESDHSHGVLNIKTDDHPLITLPELKPGDEVQILTGRWVGTFATVEAVNGKVITVRAKNWYVSQKRDRSDLKFIKRGESDANG